MQQVQKVSLDTKIALMDSKVLLTIRQGIKGKYDLAQKAVVQVAPKKGRVQIFETFIIEALES